MHSENWASKLFIASLFIYSFIAIFVYNFWFIGDEGYYSLSIYEAIKNGPNLYITFFGTPVFWKPFLMVDIYALLSQPLSLFLPPTISYRLVSALFSAIDVSLVYIISREFLGEKKALLASVVYMLHPIILLYGTKVFMETIAMTFVLGGLVAITRLCRNDCNNEYLMGALAIMGIVGASFSKSTTIGLMAFLIYALYVYFANKRKTIDIILIGAFSAIIIFLVPFLTQFPDAFFRLYSEDFFTRRFNEDFWWENFVSVVSSMVYLIPIFITGWKDIKLTEGKNLFLLLWILPLLFIALKTPYVWYAFYFIMPISILSIKAIPINKFDLMVLAMLIMLGVLIFIETNNDHVSETNELQTIKFIQKNIEPPSCILYVGAISPVVYSYLEHWGYNFNVVITNTLLRNSTDVVMDANITQDALETLVNNYENSTVGIPIESQKYLFASWTGSNEQLFIRTNNLNCTNFDYVAVTDYYKTYRINGYELVSDEKQIRIWKKTT